MTTGPRNLRRQRRCWRRKMSTKTSTMTTEASEEDRQNVQGIRDNNRSVSGSKTGPIGWQRLQSVDFPFYCVANSNIVSSLSCRYLVLIFFSSHFFFLFTARNTISTAIMQKLFSYQLYTNLEYVFLTYRRVTKL